MFTHFDGFPSLYSGGKEFPVATARAHAISCRMLPTV
jgi:hypothetical protein